MANKMLIDAAHPEETRVVVVRGSRVEEFDFEAANKKQLRGNIYLAKVTRVEPSLQAAFVDYGGNRHGFLAFSEIHPDYYQIPVADRQALLEEEYNHSDSDGDAESDAADSNGKKSKKSARTKDEASADDAAQPSEDGDDDSDSEDQGDDDVEMVGAEDALEEVPVRRRTSRRHYKIQEVIKRRQVMLVQVVKEERGNKGAALTTYLSLAGRYSVLMPNTARGGGISRKITNPSDRKRLKEVAQELDVADGMGVILRTAGASRTKSEIKRDFEYLLRLWETVRDLTLDSAAPVLVYEEGSLIKRSIRDLYNRDIAQIEVAGDEGYREAKDFMRMLIPSHAKNVQPYRESVPIFTRNGVESQLDAMFSPQVTLKSGGYIVINQTEALVAIDVNSGKSTREHSIEDTALQTNLEASDEISRQLRLRDLAGLIVIDYIDMEENRNNRAVERRLKDCLKSDRARIQIGRISHFGLMEMSRQRIRTGVLEGSTELCPTCQGAGIVRSTESVALHILRALEDFLNKGVSHHLDVRTRTSAALYILNQKRPHLTELEARYRLNIAIIADDDINGQHFVVERGEQISDDDEFRPVATTVQPDSVLPDEEEATDEAEGEGRKRKRRRRRRRGGADNGDGVDRTDDTASADVSFAEATEDTDAGETSGDDDQASGDGDAIQADGTDGEGGKRRRRRGRRGGRRNRRGTGDRTEETSETENGEAVAEAGADAEQVEGQPSTEEPDAEEMSIEVAAEADGELTDANAKISEAATADSEVEPEASDEDAADTDMAEEMPVEAADDTPITLPELPLSAVEDAQPSSDSDDTNGEPTLVANGDDEPAITEAASEEPETPDVVPPAPEAIDGDADDAADDRSKRTGWWQRKTFL